MTDSSNSKINNPSEIGINHWLVFSIVAMALLMMTIDSTIVATALHSLQKDLDTSISWAGWTLTAYSFGFVLMLPLSAKLSIRFGHKLIFMFSVLVFTLASLLCGLSDNIYLLIFFRIIQAMGGAGITPSATGLIVDHFGSARSQFLGLFGSIFSSGVIIGPIFGGLFVTYWSWHWIFFINLPLGLAVLILAARIIPKDKIKTAKREKLDLPGLLLMGISILTAMYAATHLAEEKEALGSPVVYIVTAVSIASFILLFRHLRKSKHPFILPKLLFGKGFGSVNLYNIIFAGMGIGLNSLVPLYAITRYGISDLKSGTLLVANGAASVILSTIMSMNINRTGYRPPLYVGTVISCFGMVLLALEPKFGMSPMSWLILSTFFIGVGFGITSPAGRNAGIQLAPEQSASIAAVRSLGMQLGQIASIAIATAIISASLHPDTTQAMIYIALAVLLILLLRPVISKIPENKGGW